MSNSKDVEFSLKVYVNKQKNKVLFAEADSDFVDVLIRFLTLPLGTVAKALRKHYGENGAPVFGSITSLYDGISNLDSAHFWAEGCKKELIDPIRTTFEYLCRNLKVDISDAAPKSEASAPAPGNGYGRVFLTLNVVPLIISDDLQILPISTGFVQTVRSLGIADMDVGIPRDVTLGFSDIMDLLKRSFVSETPLSDIILNKRQINSATPKSEPRIIKMDRQANSKSRKMILKVMVQAPMNKLLYAQADEDFVDFLFSLLAVPLGAVEKQAGTHNPCFKSINNLYGSVVNHINGKLWAYVDTKETLTNAEVGCGYIPENPIIPFAEESSMFSSYKAANFPKGKGKYVKGPNMYNISDDLTVTPFSILSTLSFLRREKINFSDVKELELSIGLDEALIILKASVTSTSALTDGINSILKASFMPLLQRK